VERALQEEEEIDETEGEDAPSVRVQQEAGTSIRHED
jgi:hypothetical protein